MSVFQTLSPKIAENSTVSNFDWDCVDGKYKYKNTNLTNMFSVQEIKDKIEVMAKDDHLEILSLLSNHTDVKLNENKSGVFVNLSQVNDIVINQLCEYITYKDNQEEQLMKMEQQKKEYKDNFFNTTNE